SHRLQVAGETVPVEIAGLASAATYTPVQLVLRCLMLVAAGFVVKNVDRIQQDLTGVCSALFAIGDGVEKIKDRRQFDAEPVPLAEGSFPYLGEGYVEGELNIFYRHA